MERWDMDLSPGTLILPASLPPGATRNTMLLRLFNAYTHPVILPLPAWERGNGGTFYTSAAGLQSPLGKPSSINP